MDRKDFFSKALLGGTVLFFAPALLNSCSKGSSPVPSNPSPTNPQVIDLSSTTYSSLQTVGGYAYYGNLIIIRTGQTSYVALSSICTHQGCTVGYSSSAKKLVCPCHGAQYNTSGAVLLGPASRALTNYTVTLNGTSLTIG